VILYESLIPPLSWYLSDGRNGLFQHVLCQPSTGTLPGSRIHLKPS
jgi:hypothetical protein